MNYLKEILAFHSLLEINQLDPVDQALWFHLMHINNKCNWAEWFTVANMSLQARLGGLDKKNLDRHRVNLINAGLLEYKNQGKRKAGRYRLISIGGDIRGNIPLETTLSVPYLSPDMPPLNKHKHKQKLLLLSASEESEEKAKSVPYKKIMDLYNGTCISLSSIRGMSRNRKTSVAARWKEHGEDISIFETLFQKAEVSNFLCGKVKNKNPKYKKFKANFDWLVNETNMLKVLEGKYDNAPLGNSEDQRDIDDFMKEWIANEEGGG